MGLPLMPALGCAGAPRPRLIDLPTLAEKIDAECPQRSLNALLESEQDPALCPVVVTDLDAALAETLEHLQVDSATIGRGDPDQDCDRPSDVGLAIAGSAAREAHRIADRACSAEVCVHERTTMLLALARYHLVLARDARWTASEHEIAREAIVRLGLVHARDIWGEAAEPYPILACRPHGPGAWETPDTWVEGVLPGTSASIRGPRNVHLVRHEAVEGVRLVARTFRGDLRSILDALPRAGLREMPPLEDVSARTLRFVGEGSAFIVLSGDSEQLLVRATFDDDQRSAPVARALMTVRWDGDANEPPIRMAEGSLPWIERRGRFHWRLCDSFDRPEECVWVERSATLADCRTSLSVPTSEGAWVPACEVRYDRGWIEQTLPMLDGQMVVGATVGEASDESSSIAAAIDLLANVRVVVRASP